MRLHSRFPLFPLCLAAAIAGCSGESPALPEAHRAPMFLVGIPGDGCFYPVVSDGIRPPINADNSSSFQLGRTIPVKIRFVDCVSGESSDALTPVIALTLLGPSGGTVNELESSSAADNGNTMRPAGDGQYLFNLSTKRSQFNAGQDLTPGVYQLTISGPGAFADVVVEFSIRP